MRSISSIVFIIYWSIVLGFAASLSVRASPGDLDVTFSEDGKLIGGGGRANGVAVQPDGKIVVVGSSSPDSYNESGDFAIARYNPDGTPDVSFGGGTGRVQTDFGQYDRAISVAVRSDGKIVVLGTWNVGVNGFGGIGLARYNPNGSLDQTFGNGTGMVLTETGQYCDLYVYGTSGDLEILPDQTILGMVGYLDFDENCLTDGMLFRYTSDGAVDTSFGNNGHVVTEQIFSSMAFQPSDGKIVLAGSTRITRLNYDGSPDTAFGSGGIVTLPAPLIYGFVALDANRKIVVAGYRESVNGSLVLARINTDGSLDTTFDGDGILIGPDQTMPASIAIQTDGKIVTAATQFSGPNNDFAILRYNVNGSPDLTFGNGDGITSVDFNNSFDYCRGLTLDNLGRAIVGGESQGRFAITRFEAEPPLQTPPPRRNGKLAFTSDRDGNREIYVMNSDGSHQTRLTNNSGVDDYPRWSPDGSKIAFLSQSPAGGYAIVLMNPDGTGRTDVTPVNYVFNEAQWRGWDGWSMSWSPDGRQIVFQEGPLETSRLVIVNTDGTGRRILTQGSTPAWSPDGSTILFTVGATYQQFALNTIRPDGTGQQGFPDVFLDPIYCQISPPDWSPDGSKIIIGGTDFVANSLLVIANADGTNPRDIYECVNRTNAPHGCSGVGFPDWSPDGRKIALTNGGPDPGLEIYIGDPNLVDPSVRLTDSMGTNANPDWQPLPPLRRNGKIAFTSDRDGNREIYIMNADGSNQTRITNNSTIDDFPTWSPDGTKIAFLGTRSSGGYAIFTMNADGANRTEVTTVNYQPPTPWFGYDWRHMSWSPDGTRIAFTELISGVGNLMVVNADGANRRQLTTGFYPAWSPDGSKILFVKASTPNSFYNLHTIRPDGTGLQFIPTVFQFNYILWDAPPIWSPDGLKIMVNSSDSANAELDILNADGTNPQFFVGLCAFSRGSNAPSGCGANWGAPAWSPDGRTIAYAQFDFTSRTTEIYSKDIGGGDEVAITQAVGSNSNPSWQSLSLDFSISGTVTTPSGQPLRNVVVSMTDTLGVRRTATTSSFGIYSFADVSVGGITLSVISRRYRFAPRVIEISGPLSSVDFVGLE